MRPAGEATRDALAAAHHVLLSHGRAVEVIRRDRPDAQVGITIDVIPIHPLTAAEDDLIATCEEDGFRNRWILDPVLRGSYPEDMVRRFARILPHDRGRRPRGDLRADRLPRRELLPPSRRQGRCQRVRADRGGGPRAGSTRSSAGRSTRTASTSCSSACTRTTTRPRCTSPRTARRSATRVGTAPSTTPSAASYLERHLAAVARAIAAGVPVDGYFVWSLLDNFEWAQRLLAALRARVRRLRDARAGAEGELPWYRDFIAGQRERSARSIS